MVKYRYVRAFLNDGTTYVSNRRAAHEVADEEWKEAIETSYALMDKPPSTSLSSGKLRLDLEDGGVLLVRMSDIHHLEYREEGEP